jgi:hypothetical protein
MKPKPTIARSASAQEPAGKVRDVTRT